MTETGNRQRDISFEGYSRRDGRDAFRKKLTFDKGVMEQAGGIIVGCVIQFRSQPLPYDVVGAWYYCIAWKILKDTGESAWYCGDVSFGVLYLYLPLFSECFCWVLASSLAPRKVPEGTQEREVCPVGIASLLYGGCHRYEVMMSFCWGQVAPFFFFCPHVRSFRLR